MYKINLHAHSEYSDGCNSIEEMAIKCKELEYCACIITDHTYSKWVEPGYSMTLEKYEKALTEAGVVSKKLQYPVIIGIELEIDNLEEMLVFGQDAIREILKIRDALGCNDFITTQDVKAIKYKYPCICILCHPCLKYLEVERFTVAYMNLFEILDGYEEYNSGQNYFREEGVVFRNIPKELENKFAFSGADAHSASTLFRGYNEITKPITSEKDLINYILNSESVIIPRVQKI